MTQKPNVLIDDLGKIAYRTALERQQSLLQGLVEIKKENRKRPVEERLIPDHYLLFCEHAPVFTLGRTGEESHLLLNQMQLEAEHIEYYKTNRGGDITFHGPGQIVGYPIFDLECFFTDVHRYVRYIEEAIIRTLAEYGLEGVRVKDFTGVWVPAMGNRPLRKICAIGIHLSRWISMHGFAFNINTDLRYFDKIIPCGIPATDKSVTSLSIELDRPMDLKEVKIKLIAHFADLFQFNPKYLSKLSQ